MHSVAKVYIVSELWLIDDTCDRFISENPEFAYTLLVQV